MSGEDVAPVSAGHAAPPSGGAEVVPASSAPLDDDTRPTWVAQLLCENTPAVNHRRRYGPC